MAKTAFENPSDRKAYVITGPTSGIGRCTALELAKYGTVVLVGRDRRKLDEMQTIIGQKGQPAVSVVCDLSDLASVRRAAAEIVALNLPIAGLLNNAGIMQMRPTQNALGWDMSFATNHLGPFALTEALVPHLPDGANVVFVVSGVEDPERPPVKVMRLRGGRYISAEAGARGEWQQPGSKIPGMDAYATSKQCNLASAMVLARELPRLRINAVEPGINPATGLGGANGFMRFLFGQIITRLPPFNRYRSTPDRAARVIMKMVTDNSAETGTYYDHQGRPMMGSALVRDPKFQDRVVAETRALLATIPTGAA
ncbi:MAG: SDR family NAD(P)-dependent oxidoreductase [Verrucomicrobiae bacterium]|nr:SDR family NAD(P)-dependent oxidoreductase [Verrucomicrobiae bacterium]